MIAVSFVGVRWLTFALRSMRSRIISRCPSRDAIMSSEKPSLSVELGSIPRSSRLRTSPKSLAFTALNRSSSVWAAAAGTTAAVATHIANEIDSLRSMLDLLRSLEQPKEVLRRRRRHVLERDAAQPSDLLGHEADVRRTVHLPAVRSRREVGRIRLNEDALQGHGLRYLPQASGVAEGHDAGKRDQEAKVHGRLRDFERLRETVHHPAGFARALLPHDP